MVPSRYHGLIFSASSRKIGTVTILAFVGTQLTFHLQCSITFVFCLPTKFNTRSSSRSLVRTGKISFLRGRHNFCIPVLIQGEKETNAKVRFLWKSHIAHNIKILYQVIYQLVWPVTQRLLFPTWQHYIQSGSQRKKGFDEMDCFDLAQDEVQSRTLVILVIKLLHTHKEGNFCPTWGITNFLKTTSVPWNSVSQSVSQWISYLHSLPQYLIATYNIPH